MPLLKLFPFNIPVEFTIVCIFQDLLLELFVKPLNAIFQEFSKIHVAALKREDAF